MMGVFHQLNSKNWGLFGDKKDDFSSKNRDVNNIPLWLLLRGMFIPRMDGKTDESAGRTLDHELNHHPNLNELVEFPLGL
jgi:hypothetical protein